MLFSKPDIQQNRIPAAIGYFGMLCFIPLLLKRKSPFAQFHAFQGLALFLMETVVFMVFLVPVIGVYVWAVVMVGLAVVSLAAYWRTLKGEAWEITYIQKIVLKLKDPASDHRDS